MFPGRNAPTRRFMSRALPVPLVMQAIRAGNSPFFNATAILAAMVWVLPQPPPPRMITGPMGAVAASC